MYVMDFDALLKAGAAVDVVRALDVFSQRWCRDKLEAKKTTRKRIIRQVKLNTDEV